MSNGEDLEEKLALVARGVQRMADSFGAVEQRLAELDRLQTISDRIDEYRVRSRSELQQVVERLDRLETTLAKRPAPAPALDADAADNLADVVAALRGELAEHLAALDGRTPGTTESADVSRLVDAVRALRDDLAQSTAQLEARISDVPPPAPPPPTVEVDIDRLVDAVRALRDDLAAATTQLQAETTATVERAATEQGSRLAQLRDAIIAMRDAIPTEVTVAPAPASTATAPATSAAEDRELRALVAEVRDALQAVHGEIVAGSGQLRTDLAAEQATLRDRLVEAVASLPAPVAEVPTYDHRFDAIESAIASLRAVEAGPPVEIPTYDDRFDALDAALAALRTFDGATGAVVDVRRYDDRFDAIEAAIAAVRADVAAATAPIDAPDPLEPRLLGIEAAITHLRDDLAIDRLETAMRQMGGELERVGSDTSDLRNDVKRSFDRVLSSITAAEDSVKGEIRAVDNRIGGLGDDLRLVRGLRDGLEALASGVDAVRQLTAKAATSQQMGELGRDLTTLLAEIESARSQVLAVDQHVAQPDAIDVRPAIQRLEQAVGDDVDELGKRIEQLAAAVEAQKHDVPADLSEAIGTRLRSLATGARQLGLGISEDLRARRRRKPAQQR